MSQNYKDTLNLPRTDFPMKANLTTREPENLDDSHAAYVGKRYLQEYFESGAFERPR